MIRYGSVCSGIEAATMAWHQLGWKPAWFSEIAPFPSAVLAHHYPEVRNLGDMTLLPEKIQQEEVEAPDVLCGGTPCQAFSVAGLRQSLNDDRGNLSLVFCEVANAIDDVRRRQGEKPAIILWENVPGVFSTNDNAFGCFLAGLVGESAPLTPTGKRWEHSGIVVGPERSVAWRILDAQYFGLAQRRKRVFVVASAREDIDIGQVLFEFGGMQRDSAPSRETGKANTTIPEKGIGGNSKQSAVVYAMDSFSSNSMKSANPHSGFHEEQIARTIDTNGTNPTTNQGGNLVLQPIGDDNDGEFMVVPSHSLSGTIVASNNECVTRATGIETPLAITFKVRAGGNSTGERGGQPNQSGGVGYLEATEQTFTISTTQDQYLAIAYTMREDATNNTFSINETEVALTLQALQPTINSHHAQNIVQEVPVAFQQNTRDEVRLIQGDGNIVGALAAQLGMKQQNYIAMHEPILWETSHGYDPVRVMDDPTLSPTLTAKMGTGGNNVPMLTQSMHDNVFAPLMARAGSSPDGSLGFPIVNSGMRVRRLTPVECERLQGFPDDFTKVPYRNKSATDCPDGLRYQALGNSWAVPVITWIGHRIMKLVAQ